MSQPNVPMHAVYGLLCICLVYCPRYDFTDCMSWDVQAYLKGVKNDIAVN